MENFQNRGIKLAIAVLVFALLSALLLPTAISAFNEDQSDTITQNEGETYNITADLDSTVTNVDSNNNEVTVALNDTANNVNKSKTISVNSNATYDMPQGNVTVNASSIDTTQSPNTSTLTYDYPNTYGWDDGSSQMFNILPLLLVLVILFFAVGVAMKEL